MKDIKDVFKKHLHYTTMNKELLDKLILHRINWMNKNPDHIEFLSNKPLGVNPIRYSTIDEDAFFIDICGIDQKELKKDLHALDGIEPNHKVASNPFYLTIAYLMYLSLTTIKDRKKANEAALEVYYIFSYKVLSSLISHYFKYDLDRDIGIMTVERLSYRYLIKKLNNWQEVLEYRGNDVLDPHGLHAKRLINLDTDTATRVVADLQGRIRNTVKDIYAVMIQVIEDGESRTATSLISSYEDGDETLGDITTGGERYTTYIKDIAYKKRDFIKDDLLEIMDLTFKNLDKKEFRKVLEHFVESAGKNDKFINEVIEDSIEINLDYLGKQGIRGKLDKDFISLMSVLKGFWLSSSSAKIHKVKDMKKELYGFSRKATGKKTKWLLITLSLAIPIYITLRAIVGKREK